MVTDDQVKAVARRVAAAFNCNYDVIFSDPKMFRILAGKVMGVTNDVIEAYEGARPSVATDDQIKSVAQAIVWATGGDDAEEAAADAIDAYEASRPTESERDRIKSAVAEYLAAQILPSGHGIPYFCSDPKGWGAIAGDIATIAISVNASSGGTTYTFPADDEGWNAEFGSPTGGES